MKIIEDSMMKEVKHRRILCWDRDFIEESEGVEIRAHRPEKRNIALLCDDEWEGVYNGYAGVLRVDGVYRMYYRACLGKSYVNEGYNEPELTAICVAESNDGIEFRKKRVGLYEFNGSKHNNIVFMRENKLDNFSVFYDENPDCPADERFKALAKYYGTGYSSLEYYASADGYSFRSMGMLGISGTFDTYNVLFWDKATERYFLYYRNFHTADGKATVFDEALDRINIRDISLATSKDFKSWTDHGRIAYAEGQPDLQMYTNNIMRYYRSDDLFIGFPTRYANHEGSEESLYDMPLGDYRRIAAEKYGRSATAVTDLAIMTSRDGFLFNRRDEAFMTPGIENRYNWWYGDCYMSYALIETPSEEWSAPNELSLYVNDYYTNRRVSFRRYAIRIDGFFSWYAGFKGGRVLTKPLTVNGSRLSLNFATAALSAVTVTVCDESGKPIEGYRSRVIFGDSLDRTVGFERPLSDLSGKTVRLLFTLQDAELYSFAFAD